MKLTKTRAALLFVAEQGAFLADLHRAWKIAGGRDPVYGSMSVNTTILSLLTSREGLRREYQKWNVLIQQHVPHIYPRHGLLTRKKKYNKANKRNQWFYKLTSKGRKALASFLETINVDTNPDWRPSELVSEDYYA